LSDRNAYRIARIAPLGILRALLAAVRPDGRTDSACRDSEQCAPLRPPTRRSLTLIFILTVVASYFGLLSGTTASMTSIEVAGLAVLGVAYVLVGTYGDLCRERSNRRVAVVTYFAFQLVLVAAIAFLSQANGIFALVPMPLVAQAATTVWRWGTAAVCLAVLAIILAAIWLNMGLTYVPQSAVTIIAMIAFVVGFSRALVREAEARSESERLTAQLQEANSQLSKYAAQAGDIAVSAERQRLARDLHDAVTQTLFSAAMIGEVLPRIWERDQAEGRRRLDELRQLTRGALAEMRTLLLELRPGALTETELGNLIRQLGDAVSSRARMDIQVALEPGRALPPDVQVALYRIIQEALNNVTKHSGASQVTVALRYPSNAVNIDVVDNGKGFDTGSVSSDHLGLNIMRERARAAGGRIDIESKPGNGTRIAVVWPASQSEEQS